jgi:imidazole glycerol-phosphate synthase subunit HisH
VIAVLDYGIGNLGSVLKAFRHVGAEAALVADPSAARGAEALVVPGDGAFGAAMDEMERRGFADLVREAAAAGRPVLGICIGMQILFEESSEHGRHLGLGLLPGRVTRIETTLPVPHMGWNRLRRRRAHPLFDGVDDGAHVYFVHSYRCDADPDVLLATTDYDGEVAAVVGRGSVLGVQFHPEKSQDVGLALIRNYVALVREEVRA